MVECPECDALFLSVSTFLTSNTHLNRKKGRTLHLLKAGAKPSTGSRKRKRFEVFAPQTLAEAAGTLQTDSIMHSTQAEGEFRDITAELKRPAPLQDKQK